jgi:ParB family chromosome partitioning protein
MAAKKKGLGRGLNALMQPGSTSPSSEKPAISRSSSSTAVKEDPAAQADGLPHEIAVNLITANPYQPRERFEEEGLEELTASIKAMGVLTPLLVRKRKGKAGGFQLIAGERRFRAAQRAGLKKVPVIVRELNDQEALEIALVENLQRRDLNIIEEAEGYQRLAEEFGLTQEAIAERVGKGRATVTNALRLLKLAPSVRDMVADGRLSNGHAKAMLSLEIAEEQESLALLAVKERWSVRETERQIRKRLSPTPPKATKSSKPDIPADHVQFLTDKLHQRFGTSVRLVPTETQANGTKRRGRLEIDFYSNDDLDRVLEILGLSDSL